MKKRIFAASMASVMALSSVSVVAFADETKADFGEAVTKAELKEYIKSLEKFVEDELDNYGTTMGENFNDAYEAAKVVADASDASDDDVTAAYQMLKAVKAKLVLHTTAELKELVNDNKSIYDTENVMNEEFNDEIYDADTWSTFESAFETAQDSVEETDQRVINDAYADLEAAVSGLKANDVVTKAQFRAAYNDFIDLVNSFEKYESWRRGKATVDANEVTFGDKATAATNKEKFKIKDATLTFAEIKDIVYGNSNSLPASILNDDATKYSTVVTDNKTKLTWITLGMGATTVKDDARAAYEKFIDNSNSSKTTLSTINTTYASMKKAVEVFKGWEVDNVKSGSKTSIKNLLDDNHEALVHALVKGTSSSASPSGGSTSPYDDHIKAIANGLELSPSDITYEADGKIKVTKAPAAGKYLVVDTNTGYVVEDAATYGKTTGKNITIKEGDDIAKYMPLNLTLAGKSLDNFNAKNQTKTVIKFSTALKAFEDVKALDESDVKEKNYKTVLDNIATGKSSGTFVAADLDTQDVVTESSTKSVVYPLVYRAMKYAIDDMFPGEDEYKKSDVASLIKDANKLIDETEANIFKTKNLDLDTARKNATAWVAAANATKGYKDGNTVTVTDTYTDYSGWTATAAYKKLKDAYDKLAKELKKLPVSFGDISATIADVADGLEAKAYGSSADAIAAALADVAYDLSTLEWTTDYEAYDDDRNFIFYNRLKTDGTDGEKAFYKKYQALLKAVEDAGKSDVTKGDIDGDGVVSALDALAALKFTVGKITLTDAQKAAADVDGDGEVSVLDALAILKSTVSQG